jgi:hypothetical protein
MQRACVAQRVFIVQCVSIVQGLGWIHHGSFPNGIGLSRRFAEQIPNSISLLSNWETDPKHLKLFI